MSENDKHPDPHLLELLVYPLSKSSLKNDAKKQELISKASNLAYPIRDGIPVMVTSQARELEEDEAG